ncbi:3-alpha,7-alpha,12-alpha-trihydroxy-5-beta-cholest-24-enoyl-CoA hydratase [Sphingobium sp. 22B]|uniref:MaoC/PaaZ C-terminal domain-containing protein n=1 Tax=unclassified Sphingobium TaxID=2611147 RepID=UPI0007862B70|nr:MULTISPECIES: MaoC/PaaZ C-terminal domain-containing protein [unclassified Sphingobium]KXU33828.1 3-alpha,7-alpha,12-alpha-trihydroxy-5-beta-cholest-24-enoyl-CoA hydratase [Sphingobium sp. AM]KYC33772.1 3-alpha,7-alpha,12-alpha-trihydroxy-5-beta-cholest-24-enoyl-CoA hydratase [Sphingobium sp. 22B]OAP33510.1 3-alpha,7-alpha,12-alpha-trihydroxy-5-beta-cholest-24-enoyl-CoA hydratase [Sphingobium sp. 20006FA]
MPLDHEALKAHIFPDVEQQFTKRDTILYALGVGCGDADADLPFLYGPELKSLPTMAVVLGSPGFWLQHQPFRLDWQRILHGEQSIDLHAPLPVEGRVVGRYEVEQIVDQGPGRHALLRCRRMLVDADSGLLLATLRESWVARGGGGFGGPAAPLPGLPPLPDSPPDLNATMTVSPRAALLYRLSGDWNPLHADPAIAREAGFDRPILHGLCTLGMAGRALLALCCHDDPDRFGSISVRFSAPVYPGERLRIDLWRAGDEVRFRMVAIDRDVTVLDRGMASLR